MQFYFSNTAGNIVIFYVCAREIIPKTPNVSKLQFPLTLSTAGWLLIARLLPLLGEYGN